MLKFLFGFLSAVADYFRNKQLIDAGKAEQEVKDLREVEAHVEQANKAMSVADPVRDKRLRKRFDRSDK